jgi:hypothetical protein
MDIERDFLETVVRPENFPKFSENKKEEQPMNDFILELLTACAPYIDSKGKLSYHTSVENFK